jgi:hypothetical protein
VLEQVEPVGIGFLDQIDLPRPKPFLDRLLPGDRFVDSLIGLNMDETKQAVSCDEAGALPSRCWKARREMSDVTPA